MKNVTFDHIISENKYLPCVSPYDPSRHRNGVLKIFRSRPDIFTRNEIVQLTKESKFSSKINSKKIVVLANDTVAGFIECLQSSQDVWTINWLAVNEQFQRQGIGRQLVDSIFEWLRNKKVYCVFVETCGCDGEAPARAFYVNQGFAPVKTEKDGYAKGHSKITFIKNL